MPSYFDYLQRIPTLWAVNLRVADVESPRGPFMVDPYDPAVPERTVYVVTAYPSQVPDALLAFQRTNRVGSGPPGRFPVLVAVAWVKNLGPLDEMNAKSIPVDAPVDVQEPPEAAARRA